MRPKTERYCHLSYVSARNKLRSIAAQNFLDSPFSVSSVFPAQPPLLLASCGALVVAHRAVVLLSEIPCPKLNR